jgi:hypothetical protein
LAARPGRDLIGIMLDADDRGHDAIDNVEADVAPHGEGEDPVRQIVRRWEIRWLEMAVGGLSVHRR